MRFVFTPPADHAAGRGDEDAILVTRFLSYATTYRAVFSNPRGLQPTDGLLDALVELLVRLHLSGFFWGDCSLSNTLFRHDAGTLEAYLVDAETSEQHPPHPSPWKPTTLRPDPRALERGLVQVGVRVLAG